MDDSQLQELIEVATYLFKIGVFLEIIRSMSSSTIVELSINNNLPQYHELMKSANEMCDNLDVTFN